MTLGLLDLDTVRFRLDGALSAVARSRFEGGKWSQRFRDEPGTEWVGHVPPDVVVREHVDRGEVVVYGSPHKATLGESVGPFGPAEFSEWVDSFAARLGVPAAVVRGARVSRFDVAVNLGVSAAPSEYIAIAEAPERMEAVGSRATTTTFKNRHGFAEITLYDKVQKLMDRRMVDAMPASWVGRNVLRVEVRFKKPRREFKRDVTVADLCDPEFWVEVAGRYHARVSSVVLREGHEAIPSPSNVREMKNFFAAGYIMLTGGSEARIARIDADQKAGLVKEQPAKRQRKAVRDLVAKYAPGADDLADELTRAIDAAVGRSLLPQRDRGRHA